MKKIILIISSIIYLSSVSTCYSQDSSRVLLLNTLNSYRSTPLLFDNTLNSKAQSYAFKLGNIINSTKGKTYTIHHSTLEYNESICVSDSLHNVIPQFIIDPDVPDKGHMKHLLGINNNDTRIGIGIYQFTNSNMSNYYLVVLVTN